MRGLRKQSIFFGRYGDKLRKLGSCGRAVLNVETRASREVEEALYRLPQVSEVAVISIPHPRWVEAVVAVNVVKSGHSLTESEVLQHSSTILASFKTPKRIVFCRRAAQESKRKASQAATARCARGIVYGWLNKAIARLR